MRVDADEVARGRGQEGSQEHQQLSERHHGGAGAEARTGIAASRAAVAAVVSGAATSAPPLPAAPPEGADAGAVDWWAPVAAT